MNTSERTGPETSEEVIELGNASVETKGIGAPFNETLGRMVGVGISE